MEDSNSLSVSLVLHNTTVFAQFVCLAELVCGTNFASLYVQFACLQDYASLQ